MGQPKFNQPEMATTFTYKPSWVKIDARNFELHGNRSTNKHTNAATSTHSLPAHCKHTDKTDYNKLCRS